MKCHWIEEQERCVKTGTIRLFYDDTYIATTCKGHSKLAMKKFKLKSFKEKRKKI